MRTSRSVMVLTAVAALTLGAFAGPVMAGDPPGNNGTVKVDGEPFDRHPDNDPHVGGCVFQVDFYGFDEGEDLFADVVFEAKPPSGSGVVLAGTVFIGEDDNSGGGSEAGLDAEASFSLVGLMSDFTAHPDQGYHVKMTVHADGSQGADTKHKTFWVTDCDDDGDGDGGGDGGGDI